MNTLLSFRSVGVDLFISLCSQLLVHFKMDVDAVVNHILVEGTGVFVFLFFNFSHSLSPSICFPPTYSFLVSLHLLHLLLSLTPLLPILALLLLLLILLFE